MNKNINYENSVPENDDERAEEIIKQCDDMFYKREEEINLILEEYAAKIELWWINCNLFI